MGVQTHTPGRVILHNHLLRCGRQMMEIRQSSQNGWWHFLSGGMLRLRDTGYGLLSKYGLTGGIGHPIFTETTFTKFIGVDLFNFVPLGRGDLYTRFWPASHSRVYLSAIVFLVWPLPACPRHRPCPEPCCVQSYLFLYAGGRRG